MTTNTMKPARRLLTAVFGYALIGVAAQGESFGHWTLPVVAVLCALYIPLALNAAAPGLVQRSQKKSKVHPVLTGKARLSKRERAAMLDQV